MKSFLSITRRMLLPLLVVFAALQFGGCASLLRHEPVQVIVAGIEPLQGEGLELRMLVKLRVQNPNEVPVEFNGVSLQLDVQGKRFATGVSSEAGRIPRFGEAVVAVPVSVSMLSVARQAIGVLSDDYRGQLAYQMTGKLAGPQFSDMRFRSNGEFSLPEEFFGRAR
ncbi:MAG TPA: LEA type 2 family protein [Thiobacillaceae bacterium]|nr:LEA type 2 family protein [Thiobacillaceae bacterium]